MQRRIRLTRYTANTVDMNNYGAYRLRVEVTAVQGPDLDDAVFIYRHNPPSPYTTQSTDNFEAVAGPPQLADYPSGAPDADHGWPFYRLNYVELDLSSTAQLDSIWTEIKAEVCVLIEAMNRLDRLKADEDAWCPGPPDDDSHSSQSV